MRKILSLAAVVAMVAVASSAANAKGPGSMGGGASSFSPGQSFRQNGPVTGYPGASGYAPGQQMRANGAATGYQGHQDTLRDGSSTEDKKEAASVGGLFRFKPVLCRPSTLFLPWQVKPAMSAHRGKPDIAHPPAVADGQNGAFDPEPTNLIACASSGTEGRLDFASACTNIGSVLPGR
jgi:hypothetical protein